MANKKTTENSTEKTLFFQRVQALCEDRGISVSDLETEADIGGGTIPGWRQGSIPIRKTLVKLSEYFNVSQDYLRGKTDDPIDYKNMDTSDFNQPVYEQFLKKCKGNVEQANREYLDFEKQQAQDALSERPATFQNNGSNYGLIGNASAPVKIINGTERTLTDHESELLRIFADLSVVEQSKVLIYASELQEGRKNE